MLELNEIIVELLCLFLFGTFFLIVLGNLEFWTDAGLRDGMDLCNFLVYLVLLIADVFAYIFHSNIVYVKSAVDNHIFHKLLAVALAL